jgi:hypothetical protein
VFYEDVSIRRHDTVAGLATAYGHADVAAVWDDPRNAALKTLRGAPERVVIGDVVFVPIPWKITREHLVVEPTGVGYDAKRDGGRGKRLSWIQTVFQDNQPAAGTTPFCVDGCPADDDLPFYWTDAELSADPKRRVKFIDHPKRPAPSAAAGTTHWRAIVSLAVVNHKRVTIFNSRVWGFNITPANVITKAGPRDATAFETKGQLDLLKGGIGTGAGNFGSQGWTFRTPPPP